MSRMKPLTRNQLAAFLPNHEAVKAFERVMGEVYELIPADVAAINASIEEVLNLAASASAKSDDALALVSRIADALELIALQPAAIVVSVPEDFLPPVQIGTMGEQQADRVSITGGIVAATRLKNAQATALVETTVVLNNGAAAAIGTLANAPVAGNPTKWIPIIDSGTTRYVPSW